MSRAKNILRRLRRDSGRASRPAAAEPEDLLADFEARLSAALEEDQSADIEALLRA